MFYRRYRSTSICVAAFDSKEKAFLNESKKYKISKYWTFEFCGLKIQLRSKQYKYLLFDIFYPTMVNTSQIFPIIRSSIFLFLLQFSLSFLVAMVRLNFPAIGNSTSPNSTSSVLRWNGIGSLKLLSFITEISILFRKAFSNSPLGLWRSVVMSP